MSSALEQRIPAGPDTRSAYHAYQWLPVLLGLAVMYVPTYIDLAHSHWNHEVHAHGPVVLVVVAWLIWRRRGVFLDAPAGRAGAAGGVALVLGLVLYVVGRSQGIALFEVGSHVPVFAGIALLFLGWRGLVRLWFPLLFLLFLVPLPGFMIEAVTGPLKNLVSQTAESLLYWAGYPIARSGVVLSIGQYQLLIADACSGLNSIYSLTALGLLYLYLTASANLARAAWLLASIVPIAFAANTLRVLILVLITFHFGDQAAQSFLHGFAGITLFVIALLLLLGLDALLRRLPALSTSGGRPMGRPEIQCKSKDVGREA